MLNFEFVTNLNWWVMAKQGGKRQGAGRKALYGEPTTTVRVPVSLAANIKAQLKQTIPFVKYPKDDRQKTITVQPVIFDENNVTIPVMLESVAVGFPSSAADYIENNINLNDYLIANPNFVVHAASCGMLNEAIGAGFEIGIPISKPRY